MVISPLAKSTDPKVGFWILRIVYLGLFSSVLVYGLMVYLLLMQGTISERGFISDFPNLDVFRTILWLIAAGHFFAIRFVKTRFLKVEALRKRPMPVVQAINSVYIIMFAIGEAIAIYGLLLFLIAALLQDFLVLAGVSLLILYWLRPKEDEYHALVRQVLRP